MVAPPLPAPKKVNAAILLVRWSFLAAGVVYGIGRQAVLAEAEVSIREEELQRKAIRDQKIAEERKEASDRDIAFFSSLIEPPPPGHHHDDDD